MLEKYPAGKFILLQLVVLSLFFMLTVSNEVLDLPHLLLGDHPTSLDQRFGEVVVEGVLYILMAILQSTIMVRLARRIRVLEGFLPICASCKSIRENQEWKAIEEYVEARSLVQFTHSLCPACCRELYPDLAESILGSVETAGAAEGSRQGGLMDDRSDLKH